MLKSIEATIDKNGQVQLQEPVSLSHTCRAIVTIIEVPGVSETALLSQQVLAEDWERPEEEEAWSHLQ
jgi:hypothetical protein